MKRLSTPALASTALSFVAATQAACSPGNAITEPVTFGTRTVPAYVLERGRDTYNRFCAPCHGIDGKAETPQGRQLDPRPRDFTQADFKHKTSPGNQLPTDAAMTKVIKNGVPGTGMPPWSQLAPGEIDGVVQYIKLFSPRWKTESPAQETSDKPR